MATASTADPVPKNLVDLSCFLLCADESSFGCLLIVTVNTLEATCHKRGNTSPVKPPSTSAFSHSGCWLQSGLWPLDWKLVACLSPHLCAFASAVPLWVALVPSPLPLAKLPGPSSRKPSLTSAGPGSSLSLGRSPWHIACRILF